MQSNPLPATAGHTDQVNLSLKEVAARFRVCPETLRAWLRRDPNFPRPFCAAGRKLLFRLSDIQEYEQRQLGGPDHAA
jgi:hypothetical protein